jgi:hypothetical protein
VYVAYSSKSARAIETANTALDLASTVNSFFKERFNPPSLATLHSALTASPSTDTSTSSRKSPKSNVPLVFCNVNPLTLIAEAHLL